MFINITHRKIRGCTDEQSFKKAYIEYFKQTDTAYLCIETEETIQGFPDVMAVHEPSSKVQFMEFKYTKTGRIKFQPSQPAFYRKYPKFKIDVVAYDAKEGRLHLFPVQFLFDENSPYKMDEKNYVDLRKVYKEF